MPRATVTLDLDRIIGTVDPMIFGQYLEHVQPGDRCIYGAILDDESSHVDERGFRTDVIAAVQELDVPIVRWPGGCFADIYHWEDGVGPIAERPVRRNWHWGGIEPNRFGTDEFLAWCEMTGIPPYLNFNLGTGTLDEAIRWIDYCNGTDPTHEVTQRQQNGRSGPWNVRHWGVGNEQWGFWEAGHMDARDYAAKLHNWTQFLKKLDPDSHFLGVGSEGANDAGWDLQVLRKAGHLIDYLTLHVYGHSIVGDVDDYYPAVTLPVYVEERIARMEAVIATAMSEIGRDDPVRISIDEWNIRHLVRDPQTGETSLRRLSPRTLQDAIAAAGVFHAMMRHAPSVGMANYVFLLNGNGVLLVEPDGIVKTPLYHLFQVYRRQAVGDVLDARVASDEFTTSVRMNKPDQYALRDVAYIDVVATVDRKRQQLSVSIVNRHLNEEATVRIVPQGFACDHKAKSWQLHHDNVQSANTFAQPDTITPTTIDLEWTGEIIVPAHSVTIVQVPISR